EELRLPWISTDTVREQMRKIVRKEDYPALFMHAHATAEMAVEFLTGNTPEEIVKHQNDESIEVWKGVRALIETDYVWKSFIVEGVAVLPHLVADLKVKTKNIQSIFLVDEDEERIRNTVFTRGLWDDADKYPDSVKEKEVAWVLAFGKFIKREAEKYKFPYIAIKDRDSCFEQVKKLVGD
ncbi:MAG TPA: hypothetical protein VJC15_00740, partial [Candidatus Paceibacterota bacterium]